MKVHATINYDEALKPVKAPGLAIFIRQTEARELMLMMRTMLADAQTPAARSGDTPFAKLYQQLKEALDG